MFQLCRRVPLIGIQGGPHLVSCSESSIIKLSSVIKLSFFLTYVFVDILITELDITLDHFIILDSEQETK